ncbi:hypothetical protein CV_1502 [Chromobacterium violaceum ATCC 12472]|uniref:Uncharacterized protein n=1 Tax=Chromobacterium violaceum (strain ATCC 12472 / DSM 30191 / JCM 1249 / CCUG 213 / NBRC 12614 / NCIMB 9131 / NCTC 9757 / MK) TaxID=243365 RepID=Q7NXX4_CHRVO|nr:hypothetical protein CV_1502 [Chromobacterium violaceum ATCC 12472]
MSTRQLCGMFPLIDCCLFYPPGTGHFAGFCPTGEPIITMYPIDCQLRIVVSKTAWKTVI